MSPFPPPVRFTDGCAVVSLPREIDTLNADAVNATLLAALGRGTAGVVADMSATSFSDAAGIRAVVRAHHRAEELGCWVRAVMPHPGVQRVAALTGAESLLYTYARLDDALPGDRDRAAAQANWPEEIKQVIPRQPHSPALASARGTARAERTHDLTPQLRSAHEQTRAIHSQMKETWERLSVTCADIAATHERLAESMPHEAARHLSFSRAARDNAMACRRLAANTS